MPDHEVGRVTFTHVLGREPEPSELAKVMSRYLHYPGGRRRIGSLPGSRRGEALGQLCGQGYLLGLTTGNVESAAHIKLERGGLNPYFCFGGYGSDSPHRGELTKRAIERAGTIFGMEVAAETVLVVGDTPRDVEAAQYAVRSQSPLRAGTSRRKSSQPPAPTTCSARSRSRCR